MQQQVSFVSDGLTLTGVLHLPDDMQAGEKRPAIMVLHGFGGNKNGGIPVVAAALFEKLGYVTLRFDMRGCGNSGGARGRVICLEQVEDAKAAVTFLAGRPEVQAACIGVMGFSFGAAVAVYAAGVDKRSRFATRKKSLCPRSSCAASTMALPAFATSPTFWRSWPTPTSNSSSCPASPTPARARKTSRWCITCSKVISASRRRCIPGPERVFAQVSARAPPALTRISCPA